MGGLWHGDCRRCLEPVSGEFDVAVQEVFTDQSGDRPTDEDLLPLQGERVDLEPVIREAVLLALPLSPLCARGCRGPAPEDYPTDSVEARIADEEDAGSARDPRWAALDALDFDERD